MKCRTTFLVLVTLLIVSAGMLTSCSDKSVNPPATTGALMAFDLSAKASFAQGVVDHFRIVVSKEADSSAILIDTTTVFLGDTVLILLDSLPASEPLVFLAQVIMSATGATIYEGRAIATLTPDDITGVEINLSPSVPMLRFTPRNIQVEQGAGFQLTLRAINIDSLFGISARIGVDDLLLQHDSTIIAPGLAPNVEFFAIYDSIPEAIDSLALGMTHTMPGASLTDIGGDADLVIVYFTGLADPSQTPSMTLEVVPTGMTKSDTSRIPLAGIYTVDCVIDFIPSSQ